MVSSSMDIESMTQPMARYSSRIASSTNIGDSPESTIICEASMGVCVADRKALNISAPSMIRKIMAEVLAVP